MILTRIALVPLVALGLAISSGPRDDASILTPQGTLGEANPKTQAGPLALVGMQTGDIPESLLPLAPPSARLASPANTWNALASGLNGNVSAIAVAGPDVYVGGKFTDAGGDLNADYIARWDGSAWHALGSTPPNWYVNALAVAGGNVYVGGDFGNIGGDTSKHGIARWDGSTWHALDGGLSSVSAIAVAGSNVYAGGLFTDAGGIPAADYIARWDGSAWNSLSGTPLNDGVFALAAAGGSIYAGGLFTDAWGLANADHIALWNGSSWSALGTGLSETVYAIAVAGRHVYAGGGFTNAGDDPNADRIARWDGSAWHSLGTGVGNGRVLEGSEVYAGGEFSAAGGIANTTRAAHWDGIAWHALGTGIPLDVYAVQIEGSQVYFGGRFTSVGGDAGMNRIARWDATELTPTWNAVGPGLTNDVTVITAAGQDVYVGGYFYNAGGEAGASHIARWNGAGWEALGSGIGPNGPIAIALVGKTVYVGGPFNGAGGDAAIYYVAYWDGSTWHSLGDYGVGGATSRRLPFPERMSMSAGRSSWPATRLTTRMSRAGMDRIGTRSAAAWTMRCMRWLPPDPMFTSADTSRTLAASEMRITLPAGTDPPGPR